MKKHFASLLLALGFVTSAFTDVVHIAVMPEPTPENPNPTMPEPAPGEVIAQ